MLAGPPAFRLHVESGGPFFCLYNALEDNTMTFKYKLSVRLALLKDWLLLLPLLAHFGCEKPAGISGPSGPSAVVSKVVVSPRQVALLPNQTSHFMAVALTATGDTASVAVTWSATGGSIVDTFSAGGRHDATYQPSAVPGTYLVIATDPPDVGFADTSTVTVMSQPVASVALSPAVASVLVGATLQLTAIPQDASGSPLPGRPVTWASSFPAVATVSATGLVTSLAAGVATITATSEGKSGTAAVTVTTVPVASLTVSPATANLQAGATAQLTATPKDASGNPLSGRVVTWSSDTPGVATVSSSGLLTATAAGSATITATSEGTTASATVTVTQVPVASVTVSPASASIVVGATQQLTAVTKDAAGATLTGRVVTWSASDASVAIVSSSGLVTGRSAGSTIITATSEGKNGTSAITVTLVPVASVTVNPPSATILVGATRQLSAVTKDAAAATLSGRVVTWSTSNTAVAAVSSSGLVSGQSAGSATITATSEGKSGTSTITVTLVPVASVTVNPPSATILVGATQQLSAVTKDAAGATLSGRVVTWSTSNASVATVSSSGLVSGQSAGSATITATSEGKSGTSSMTVQASSPGTHVGYYVTPGGSGSGNGSANQPWDLQTALNHPAAVQPGDTIWVRAGRYVGNYTSRSNGTAANPIWVRAYPGERVTIDGGGGTGAILLAVGSYTWFVDFEIMMSNPQASNWSAAGVSNYSAVGNKYINLVVHDNAGAGFGNFTENGPRNAEFYGNLIYNNGSIQYAGSIHGMYLTNQLSLGTVRVFDNIVFNNSGFGIH